MTRQIFDFDEPDRFVAGTVGEPGQRAFFLQARQGRRVTSVLLEKSQVAILAERVDELLDTILRRSQGEASIPAVAPHDLADRGPLESPVEEEFRVGTLGLGWDPERDRVVIEAYATPIETDEPGDDALPTPLASEEDDGDDDDDASEVDPDADVMRVLLTGALARAFAARATSLVAAGRPLCPFCNEPLDPEGHLCVRMNGYRRRPT
jgi:uncharacterized repeat protein (TIGR03847 family)